MFLVMLQYLIPNEFEKKKCLSHIQTLLDNSLETCSYKETDMPGMIVYAFTSYLDREDFLKNIKRTMSEWLPFIKIKGAEPPLSLKTGKNKSEKNSEKYKIYKSNPLT